MKRRDKVYLSVKEMLKDVDLNKLKSGFGINAQQVADKLNILRNNVSLELNALTREKKLVKIKKRPVLYICTDIIENALKRTLGEHEFEIVDFSELIDDKRFVKDDPFDVMVGSRESLKSQIEKAKAAILYPPNGLHTLIIGPTGVGKTLFANIMYDFGVSSEKMTKDSPFIVFNCADYYNNPQFLISHIFGYVKGAFTGADSEHTGLVELADGGILFLDEIHRLPAEGQEMIFNFMDTGTFKKLGESDNLRSSNVLIIGATTEDPHSALLETFMRRIPMMIEIPSIEKRTTKEKIGLAKYLLSNEARRVGKNIHIDRDSLKALIGSASYGNVGQLKSNIQLVCANGFLNSLEKTEYIDIKYASLTQQIRNGIYYYSKRPNEAEEVTALVGRSTIITPHTFKPIKKEDDYEPDFNLYEIIEGKADILRRDGENDVFIKNFISKDISIHLRDFISKFDNSSLYRSKLRKLVDHEVIDFTKDMKVILEKEYDFELSERFIYVFSLHFSAFLERLNSNVDLKYSDIEIDKNSIQYKAASRLKEEISLKYNIDVPEMEVPYLTVLLDSLKNRNENARVSILVVCHGNSTASSMVCVAENIIDGGVIKAIDMPLDVSPTEIFDNMLAVIKKLNQGKGVLILVDMGSLTGFNDKLMKRSGIMLKTIDMVSTAMCIEALRKSAMLDMDLDMLYQSIKNFHGYGKFALVDDLDESETLSKTKEMHLDDDLDEKTISRDEKIKKMKKIELKVFDKTKKKAIVTICSTGAGTANKLKIMTENYLKAMTNETVPVFAVSVVEMDEKIEKLKNEYEILASIGIRDPKINRPYISVESFIMGDSEELLREILKNNFKDVNKNTEFMTREMVMDSLNEFLVYINPTKIIDVLFRFIMQIEESLNCKYTTSKKIQLMIHTGIAMERLLIGNGTVYTGDIEKLDKSVLKIVMDAGKMFYSGLNIKLNKDEASFIVDILAS